MSTCYEIEQPHEVHEDLTEEKLRDFLTDWVSEIFLNPGESITISSYTASGEKILLTINAYE
jgi:hypothetical protein